MSLSRPQAEHIQRGEARAHSKLECGASFPETASAGAPALHVTRDAGLVLEATAGTSRHMRALKERGLSDSTVPFQRARPDYDQRSMLHAQSM